MTPVHPEALVQSGPAPTPELGETLRVVSKDTATLRFMWNSRVYPLTPGGEVYMPFDAVKLYFGDPRATSLTRTLRDSIGIVSFLPDRATEVRRLRLLYMAPFGEYMAAESAGGIFQTVRDHSPTGGPAFESVRVPQVEVYNIRGERILTVLDDPEGDTVLAASQTNSQVAGYEAALAHQQAVINAMATRLGIDPTTGALLNAPDLTGEEPPGEGEDGTGAAPDDSARDSHIPPDDVERNADGSPKMVYSQRTNSVQTKRKPRPADPSTIDDLPEDAI